MHPLLKSSEIFVDGLDHPECLAIHPDGSVWAGGEAGQIYRITEDGSQTEMIISTGGFILGIAFSPGAEWLAICDLNNHCVWKLDVQSNTLTKLSDNLINHSFNIPNYPVFDNVGNLYVSESGNFREVNGKVIKFSADGSGDVWHNGPFNFANGLALDTEQKNLFVACSWLPGVEKVSINPDGSAGSRHVYCTLPESVPDGIAFDEIGNLLVSCYIPNTIFKVANDQTTSVLVDDWEAHTLSNPTNIAFGGKDFKQLFVSNLGRWHILKINYDQKGMSLASHNREK